MAAYYEFVDHDLLCAELTAQTGDQLAIDALAEVLASVLGRRVGLPQVHPSSDVLGDTYIDPVRRRMLRQGHVVFTYSDDFRIASATLGNARSSLETCEMEVRALGLILNERKTFTYGRDNYEQALTSFADAEQRLFAGDTPSQRPLELGFLDPEYPDEDGDRTAPQSLGSLPLDTGVDDEEAILVDDETHVPLGIETNRVRAAQRAWDLWTGEDGPEHAQPGQEAAIAQSLLGRALPLLGAADDRSPLDSLPLLLRREPALTPQVAAYLKAYGENGAPARANIRSALDEVTNDSILSTWQGIWLADVAGAVRRSRRSHSYEDWLTSCIIDGPDGLAATAAAALGRLGRGDSDVIAAAIERVGAEWRRLAFWGLIGLDRAKAEDTADDELDRLMIEAWPR